MYARYLEISFICGSSPYIDLIALVYDVLQTLDGRVEDVRGEDRREGGRVHLEQHERTRDRREVQDLGEILTDLKKRERFCHC